MQVITDALQHHAATAAARAFLICGDFSLTYGQLLSCVTRAAIWMSAQGISPGDRVVLTVGARDPWFAVTYLATHLAGAVAIPVGAQTAAATRASILQQVHPAFDLSEQLLDQLKQAVAADTAATSDWTPPEVRPEDVADILFTSGTTGQPKGVVLTHANIMAAAKMITTFIGNGAGDREVVTVPLSHSFGLGRLRSNLLAGGTLVVVPGLSFPALVFRALEEHAATGLACVPTGAAVMLKWGAARLGGCASNLRYVELGSSPMAPALRQQLMSLLPTTRICMHYGLTEASRSAFIEFHADAAKLGSVGKPSPGVSIQIVDESEKVALPESIGRIRIRAATVLKEYWRNPQLTRRVLQAGGWFETGDLGHFDADGYLYFDGRRDDLINVGGKKVYPETVEEAAVAHPAVDEAACVGEADPNQVLGDVPALYVVCKEAREVAAQELIGFIADRVEAHAVPTRVEFVSKLPKTAAGKVQRRLLRNQGAPPAVGPD